MWSRRYLVVHHSVKLVQFSSEIVMKAAFMWTPAVAQVTGDATASHQALPRVTRKALRVTKTPTVTKTNNTTYTDLTETFRRDRPMYVHDLALNTCDPDACFDEFNDDDGLDSLENDCTNAGLTIVAMGKDTRRWLKGYNIL